MSDFRGYEMAMREMQDRLAAKDAEIERLTNKLNTDSQQFELECRKAQIARLEQRHDTACHLMHRLCDWFYRRTDDAEDAAFIDAERFLSEHAPKRREK